LTIVFATLLVLPIDNEVGFSGLCSIVNDILSKDSVLPVRWYGVVLHQLFLTADFEVNFGSFVCEFVDYVYGLVRFLPTPRCINLK
jgi:hypothetical protein